jgi:carbonic anhydrase
VPGDVFEELFGAAEEFHQHFSPDGLTAAPTRHVVVLSCMDARLDLFRLLGLAIGDSHILRNAGGRATDDAIRSLVVSANWLGTRRALVIHHTGCGLFGETDDSMREHVRESIGLDPVNIEFHPIADLEASVREDVARIRACEFLPAEYEVRGAIYDVATGALAPVDD